MVPEIYIENDGNPPGSIEVNFIFRSYHGFRFEPQRYGVLRLDLGPGPIEDFLKGLTEHVKLSQPPSNLVQGFCINQLISQLRGENREIKPVSIHFSDTELIGTSRDYRGHNEPHGLMLRFTNQEVLNETFLKLLPFNQFHGYDKSYTDGLRLAKLLKALGKLDEPTLDHITEQMPPLKHPDPKSSNNWGNPIQIVIAARDKLPTRRYG